MAKTWPFIAGKERLAGRFAEVVQRWEGRLSDEIVLVKPTPKSESSVYFFLLSPFPS